MTGLEKPDPLKKREGIIAVPGCYDALTAKRMEKSGLEEEARWT